ncbi:MAG TPA: hypothetical protein PLB02_12330 [Thermoanaerobaculia bacterium]|nr:hypothetical protein [Thermoanaerobaculia bacterium]HQR68169.1 hypothetical protein [Thermoanaerobaculia bacterium]
MIRSRHLRRTLVAVLLALPAVASSAWRSEGPFVANIRDVAVDPAKPETLYAATSGGGVFRSDDGGQTWSLPGDGMVSRGVEWIEVDPRDPATLWAGVKGGPSAFWRSPDRGKSWAPVRVDPTSSAVGQRIAFAASKPGTIFVPSTNLHYRSSDGGKSWQSFRVPDQDVYAFAVHPRDANIVWAGGRGSEHNLSRSQDGGRTWRPFGQGLRQDSIKLLRVSAASPSTLYAVSGFGHLHRSVDGGATWTELELGLRGTDEIYALAIDPHDPQALLAATKRGLRASGDGGVTWRTAGSGLGDYLCRAVAFHPATAGTVYAGTGGDGFYRSTDGGRTFEASGKGMAAGWVERLWAPPSGTGPVFAQLSVGLFRMDGPGAWTEIRAPFKSDEPAKIDGVVFDRESPKRVHAHVASSWFRSEDGGRTFSRVEIKGPSMSDMMKGRLAEPQFKSLAQDAADPKTFWAGSWSNSDPGTAVFKSTDGGKKWQPAGSGITSPGAALLRSVTPGAVYAACGKDGLFRTTDGGKSWSLVRAGEVADLAPDPSQPGRLFAATKEGLFRSTDAGATWSRTAQGLEGDEVEAVAVARDGQAFAGTFHGVFRSTDGGATWKAMNDGLADTDVRALAIAGGSPARLYAGLAGGSIVSIELP